MAKIVLDNNTREVLEVVIGEATYNIPLGSSLSWKEANSIKTQDDVLAFFSKYIPEDVFESLSMANITVIINEWRKATEITGGAKFGQ